MVAYKVRAVTVSPSRRQPIRVPGPLSRWGCLLAPPV